MREKVFQPYSIGPRADATPWGFMSSEILAFMSPENPQKFHRKAQNDILVAAFMSPENRGRPGPGQAWPGCALCGCHTASLWLPHRPRGAAREAREAREGREARAARAKV